MLKRLLLSGLLVLPVLSQDQPETVRGKRFTFNFSSTEIANLVWQLDTMAGLTVGDASAYRHLWREKQHWTESDDAQLRSWATLAKKHRSQRLNPPPNMPYPPNAPRYYGRSASKTQNLVLAALNAKDLADYRRRLTVIVGRKDAESFAEVAAHFQPRFQHWWKSSAERKMTRLAEDFTAVVRDYGLMEVADQIATFTGAELPPQPQIYFHLIAHPRADRKGALGTQVRNHVIVELDEAGAAVQRISLLMHELAHHFYESAPAAKHARLIREFLAAPEEYSMGLYSYLNEAVATAAAIHVENQIRRPASFAEFLGAESQVNRNPLIAKLGIAIFTMVEKRLRQGRTIFDGFTPEYISAACKGLGQLCGSPSVELATRTVIFLDPAAGAAAEEFPKHEHSIVTLSGWQPLRKYRQLSGAVFLMTGEVKWFLKEGKVLPSKTRPAIRSAFEQNRSFVYGLRRAGKGKIYLFVADDRASLEEVVRAFTKSNEPFEGVRFASKR